MIKIYDINDNVLMQAEVTSAAKREQEMSKSDYISLSFSAAEKIILPAGAYIYHTYKIDKVREVTRKFLLLESYEPTQSDECSWKYTPQFQHPKMILSKTPFFIYTRNSQNVKVKQNVWSFVGTTSVLSGKIADFLNKDLMFGECGWKVIFQKVTANTINVSFSDNDFISALTAITNAIGDNCEWHIDYDDEIIYIGKVLIGATPVVLEVGKNVGVPSINNSKEGYYNAFSIFGGTRNITQVNSKGENVSSGDIRLQLEEGNGTITIDGKECSYSIDKYSTLDLRADKTKEPLFTKVLDFSQIYPSLNTYVYNVRGRVKYVLDKNNEKIPISYNTDGSVKEYKTFTVWYMRLAYPTTEKVEGKKIINTTVDNGVTHYWYDFEITDDLLINGKNIGCSFEANFNTGALSTPLAGRGSNGEYVGFELTYHKEASSSHTSDDVSKGNFSILAGDYEIIYQEDNEVIIPTNAAEMLIPRGESMPSLKCNITVLYNIAMADTIYYEDAQNRLLEKAKEEIVRLLSDLNNYEVKSYSDVFLEDNPQLQIGQSVTYKDGHGYELATRVLKLSINIDYDFVQSITLGNQAIKGTITQLKEDVQTIIANGGNSGNGGGFSVSQLRSLIAKYGSDNFISKQFDDIAHGTITWEKVQKLLGGLQSGEFESGLYGHGAHVDKRGDAEFNSIFAREFIRVPKFVFNEIEVTKAEHWNTNGYGTIKTVDTQKHIISLKLEENDYGSLMVGDICRGIYADLGDAYKSSQNNEGTLDENNFIVRKGFFTSYFYVKKVITAQKGEFVFEYGKKSDAYPDPCPFMDFAQYGNFNNTQRQSSMYFSSRGRSYIEVLEGVNSWEIQAEHRVCRYGDLTGLFIRKDDGTMTNLKGNGLFAQNHVYLVGAVITLSNISDLDDLVLKLSTYDVTLSAYSSVITVDDMGNVIDGLWTQDSEGGNKQYRISTAVFVSQAGKPLLLEDESSKYCTEGHYRVYATGDGCDVSVANGTVFVTGIDNIKDGVAGSGDDSSFDYDVMRTMTDCKATIVVELEGKGTRTLDFPIRIHHDSLPFMVCDLTNEHAAVSWHTKHAHYAGLPLQTEVNMMYKNTPYSISELSVSLPSSVSKYLKATVTDSAKAKVVAIDKVSDFVSDVLPTSFDITITAVAIYAGARYEYTKVLTISKTSDYVVYELVPSVNSVTVDSADRVSPSSVSCDVWATSSDDKRYKVTLLPSGFGLYYSKNDNALSSISLGGSVSVSASDNKVSFVLKHTEGGVEYIDDKEDIPVVSDGKESAVVYSSDNIVSIPVDVNGKVLSALNASVSFRIFAGDKELTVNSVAISSLPSNRAVSANVSNNVLVLKCGAGTSFGKEEVSYTLSVQGANGNVTHTGYTTVKVLPNVMGKSVKDVNTYYALNDSATSKPADSSFTYDAISSAVISSNASKYLWSGDKITYDDNTTAITGVYMVGRCSELATVTEQYAKTTTNSAPSSGWSETYPSVGKGVYVWSRDKITWKNGSVTYSAAQLVAYIGNDSTVPGPKGDSITITSTSVTYQIHNSGTTPPTGTWSPSIPSVTDEKPYLWTKTYVLYSDGTSTTSFSVATKGKQGASVTGRTGSVVRSSIWKTGVAFYCGDTLVNGQYYVDVVYVADDTESDGWAKYQCIKNHTSSSSITTSNGTYWKRMSSASIYAPLIVGKNASIDFAQGQQFNLMEGNSVWGSFRYVNTGDSPALWLGGTDSRYAPFSVTKNGYIKATSGQIGSFRITEFTDSVSKLKFYDLYAGHDSFGVIEASQLNLGAQGITVGVGNASLGAYGRISMGHAGAGNKETGFTYNNILSVNVVCHNGDETGATYISAEGSVEKVKALTVYAAQGTHNYAVYSDAGMIRGALCPRVKVISSDYSLKENDNVIICTNSGAIDIQFPSNPAVGQSYIIIQVDGNLYFKGGAPFRGRLSDANRNSLTKGQINFFFFDGTHWSNSYAC